MVSRFFILMAAYIVGFSTFLYSQNESVNFKNDSSINKVKIGEKVPDYLFKEMVNYPTDCAKISDFRGKLLILDFWHIHCAICIQQFSKLNELQKEFDDEIMILPVGINSIRKNEISNFVEQRKGTKFKLDLPTASEQFVDSTLFKLFPWQGMPHEVWIDKEGILRGITDHKSVTKENIKAVLANNYSVLPVIKTKRYLDLCKEKFLLDKDSIISNQNYGSKFSRFIDTLVDSPSLLDYTSIPCDKQFWNLANVNQPLLYSLFLAYKSIFPELANEYKKRIIVDVANNNPLFIDWVDTIAFNNLQYEEFTRNNLFCYELMMPRSVEFKDVLQRVIEDYEKEFKVKTSIETRTMKCLALVKFDKQRKLGSKFSEYYAEQSMGYDSLELKFCPIEDFVLYFLNPGLPSFIIINETGYMGKIDVSLMQIRKDNYLSYKAALQKNNLDLIEVRRNMPMLIIKDRSSVDIK